MIYLLFGIGMVALLVAFYLLYRAIDSLRADLDKDVWHPLLIETVETCRGQSKLMEMVKGIAGQFQSDSGLSMKDAVNRLGVAAKQQFEAAEFLKAGVREDRHKAELDREQLQRLLIELHRLTIKVECSIATADRIELAAEGVAKDLSDAHKRADEVGSGEHGAAADAASRQTQKEKESHG